MLLVCEIWKARWLWPRKQFHTWTSWQLEILVQLLMRIKPRVPLHWQTAWDGVKAPGINVGTGAVIK